MASRSLPFQKQFRHRFRVRQWRHCVLRQPRLFGPKDVFVVLFDPLPLNAHGSGEWVEALENTVLVAIVLHLSGRYEYFSARLSPAHT